MGDNLQIISKWIVACHLRWVAKWTLRLLKFAYSRTFQSVSKSFKILSNFLSVWRIEVPEGGDGLLTDVSLSGFYSVQKYLNLQGKNSEEDSRVTEKEY